MKKILSLAACLGAVFFSATAQGVPDPGDVTRPFVQRMDHYGALGALRSIETESRAAGRMPQYLFDTYLANIHAFNGRLDSANIAYYQTLYGYPLSTEAPEPTEPADYSSLRAVDAREYILDYAEGSQVVMLNESHTCPVGRIFARGLLSGLREHGYEYLCLEALAYRPEPYTDLASATDPEAGYYTAESNYGELIREALRLGYTIYGYDDWGPGRDSLQAAHISELVFERDPAARAIVLAGHGHIVNSGNTLYRYLKQATGLDYVAFDQDVQRERPALRYEGALYRDYFRGLDLDAPAVLVDSAGVVVPVDEGRDVSVFTPPTRLVHGRPHWLLQDGRRAPVRVQVEQPSVVKAYYADEVALVPADGRVMVPPADVLVVETLTSDPCLILAPGRYVVQYWSLDGVLLRTEKLEV